MKNKLTEFKGVLGEKLHIDLNKVSFIDEETGTVIIEGFVVIIAKGEIKKFLKYFEV